MPGLLIKDLSDGTHRRLKARAAKHRRSMTREALVMLEEALSDRAGPPTLQAIDTLRVSGRRPLTRSLVQRALTEGRR